jgi:hypothetical protein
MGSSVSLTHSIYVSGTTDRYVSQDVYRYNHIYAVLPNTSSISGRDKKTEERQKKKNSVPS